MMKLILVLRVSSLKKYNNKWRPILQKTQINKFRCLLYIKICTENYFNLKACTIAVCEF